MKIATYKRLTAALAAAMVFSAILPATINLLVDPYHIYHKGVFPNHQFNSEKIGLMAGGLVDNYIADHDEGFDSVIIGTSTSVNYSSSQTNSILGWKRTANISLNGSNYDHHQMLMQRILQQDHIKHIFLEISYHLKDKVIGIKPTFTDDILTPAYLYERNLKNDYKYLFDMYVFFESFRIAAGHSENYLMTPELPAAWASRPFARKEIEKQKSAAVLNGVIESTINANPVHDISQEEKSHLDFPAIEYRLLPSIMHSCNSDIEFILVFAPRPLSLWLLQTDERHEMYMRRYLVEKVAPCKNMRVYSTEQFQTLAGDPANFIDDAHYIPDVNDKILRSILSGESLLTIENIDQYERQVIENLNTLPEFLQSLVASRKERQ